MRGMRRWAFEFNSVKPTLMSIEIVRLDPSNEERFRDVVALQRKAFPHVPEIEEQARHNARRASAVFYGAFVEGTLVGVNGFLRHSIDLGGSTQIAFQSCSSATDP